MVKKLTLSFVLALCGLIAIGQHVEVTDSKSEKHHGMKSSHRVTLGLGHTYLSEGVVNGKKSSLALPSWSLSYDYWLKDNWAIGLQTDYITETFLVKTDEGEEIERSLPLSIVPVALFKPGKHLAFIGGLGVEYTESETLTMTRLGLEYGIHMPQNWEFSAEFIWDYKWNSYNSWSLALCVSKIFARKRKH